MTYSLALLRRRPFAAARTSSRPHTTMDFPCMHAPARVLLSVVFVLLFFFLPSTILRALRVTIFFQPSQRDHDHGSLHCILHAFDHTFPTSSSQESIHRITIIPCFTVTLSSLAPRTSRSHKIEFPSFVSSLCPLFPPSSFLPLPRVHHGSSSRLPPWPVRYDHLH